MQELGAIRLRMQWVHSLKGLVSHLASWSEAKLCEIKQQEAQAERDKVERQQALQRQAQEKGFHSRSRELSQTVRLG